MQIKTFYFNPYREATYVINQEGSAECLIIDAGPYEEKEKDRLRSYIAEQQLIPVGLLITHTHPDHVCGQDFIEQEYGLKAIVFPAEDTLTLRRWSGKIEVLRTPGHNEDCVCYYFPDESVIFTGDTLFQGSIGRTDLPGGDYFKLMQSLRRLSTLPEDTKVYPGHGYPTTIGDEKRNNPYI